jgi:hypothetical protein
MKRILVGAIALVIGSLSAIPALAFGADGHEAVCEIAYRELTNSARSRVDELIALDGDSRVESFRDSCVWPDFKGAVQNSRRNNHYINIPRHWTSIWYQRCHGADECLFTAIQSDAAILTNAWASDQERLVALKFLGHWAGDIHQPLHVSYADDRGGNEILVEGVAGCRRNGQTKLHAVWDTCIPRDIMEELDARNVAPDDDDREAFGGLLQQSITEAQRTSWTSSLSPLDWANESLEIARRSEVGYCFRSGNRCRYSQSTDEYVENDPADDEVKRTFSPQGDYEDQFGALVTQRLQAAGVRLGAMLNSIFDQ